MINCLFKKRRYCSFDLKNQYGNYIFTEVKLIKKAGQNHQLKCEECGKPVILKAGDRRIPHFAHLSSNNCNYSNYSKESEEHIKGKLILYHYFRDKYPDAEVMVDYRLSNGRRANTFIIFNNGKKLAVEYQRKDIKVKDWLLRHQDYHKLGINDLWILSTKQYRPLKAIKNDKFIFFNDLLIHDSDNSTAYFLNTDTQQITLIKKMEYKNEYDVIINQKYYWQEYLLDDIRILPDGRIDCNFTIKYEYEKKYFIEQIKQSEKLKEKKSYQRNNSLHNSIKNYQRNRSNNQSTKNNKSMEELEIEAEKSQMDNPDGPWMDSRNDRWGFCKECGLFTKDWVSFDGKNNTCICRECRYDEARRENND